MWIKPKFEKILYTSRAVDLEPKNLSQNRKKSFGALDTHSIKNLPSNI